MVKKWDEWGEDSVDVPEKKKKKVGRPRKKKRGRPRKKRKPGPKPRNWLSFEEARGFVQDECIPHRDAYFKWHDWNKPKQIPKYPYFTYRDSGWKGWNDWLGNNNVFKSGARKYCRPFFEAVAWVHKLGLRSQQQWFDYIRENGIPDDIPSRPEVYYNQWISWPHWLGNTVSARVSATQEIAKESGVLYIIQYQGRPANVFGIGVESGGVSALKDKMKEKPFRVIKLFKYEQGVDWKAIVAQFAKPWWENSAEFVVTNINELIFEIGGELEFVR